METKPQKWQVEIKLTKMGRGWHSPETETIYGVSDAQYEEIKHVIEGCIIKVINEIGTDQK